MKTLLFLSFFLPFTVVAQCHHNEDGIISCKEKELNQYQSFQDVLEWWAASPEQIKTAKCNLPEKTTAAQMEEYLDSNKEGVLASESFYGINLIDEDIHLIDLLKKLTTYDDPYLAGQSNPEEERKKHQKNFEIPSDCQKVKCAVSHIFGNELGLKLLYALDKYEMNMSELTEENLAQFTSDEADLILEALDDLPATLFPFKKNKSLKHYKRGYGPSETTVANAMIRLFYAWDNESKENKMLTIIHEVGHNIGHHFKLDQSKEWLDFSGWVNKDDTWTASKPEAIVSEYGKSNPAEDFAETVVSYRYNPANLKKRSPEKYEFIKKYVFQGIEYDSEENCALKKAAIYPLLEKLSKEDIKIDNYDECHHELRSFFDQKSSPLKSCLERQYTKGAFKKLFEEDPELKKDSKLQNILLSSASTMNLKIAEVTEKEIINIKTRAVESMINSFKNSFSTILGCESAKANGWQNFISFNEEMIGESFPRPRLLDDQKASEISHAVCLKLGNRRTAKCEELAEFFVPMLPSNNNNILLTTDANNRCVLKKPSTTKELQKALEAQKN